MRKSVIAFTIFLSSLSLPAYSEQTSDFIFNYESCKENFNDRKPMPNCQYVLDGITKFEFNDDGRVIAKYSSTPCETMFHLIDNNKMKPVSQSTFCKTLVDASERTPIYYTGSSCC